VNHDFPARLSRLIPDRDADRPWQAVVSQIDDSPWRTRRGEVNSDWPKIGNIQKITTRKSWQPNDFRAKSRFLWNLSQLI